MGLLPASVTRAEVLLERAVVLTGEWYPFTSEELEGSGELSSLVTRALKGAGVLADYQFLPFSSVLQRTWEGDAIGTFPWFRTDAREARFLYSQPIVDVEYLIYYNGDAGSGIADITAFEDLADFTTTRVKGYAYGKLDCVIEGLPGPDCSSETLSLDRVDSEFRAFELLASGEIDYFAASRSVARAVIERSFPFEDRRRFAVLEGDAFAWRMELHFIVPRNRSDAQRVIDAFDIALGELAAEGRVAATRERLDTFAYASEGVVRLVAGDTDGIAARRDIGGREEPVMLPAGSRGIVLRWSDRYLGGIDTRDAAPGMVRVQLVNGPLRGERVWVADTAIELE